MPLLGQASGGWTESSSALRILYVGIRNSTSVLTDDALTQTNPVAVATNVSTRLDTTKAGVLSGSVAFTRPDGGSNHIGGPGTNAIQTVAAATPAQVLGWRPLGIFINSAVGNSFENTPGIASGIGPYVSGLGTYGDALYETAMIGAAVGADPAAGVAIVYRTGNALMASRNGLLMPTQGLTVAAGALVSLDSATVSTESFVTGVANSATVIGVLKMPPDATQTELVFDQRI